MDLVTGATGFIGAQLVRHLLESGQKVRILVRSPQKAEAVFGTLCESLDVAEGDLGDAASLAWAAAGVERVYHLASRINFQGSLKRMRAINVEGTRRLLDACVAAGVKRVVHMSSIAAWWAGGHGRERPLPRPHGGGRAGAAARRIRHHQAGAGAAGAFLSGQGAGGGGGAPQRSSARATPTA